MKMNKQTGSVLMLILVFIGLSSASAVLLLKLGASFTQQLNQTTIAAKAKELLTTHLTQIKSELNTPISATDLPRTINQQYEISGLAFTSTLTQNLISQNIDPFKAYSLNSRFGNQLFSTHLQIHGHSLRSKQTILLTSCLTTSNQAFDNQPADRYPLNLSPDEYSDIEFQLDSASGEIWRIGTRRELVLQLPLTANQRFSRADFSIVNFNAAPYVLMLFLIHTNTLPATNPTNTLYLIPQGNLFKPASHSTLQEQDLLDLSSQTHFSVDSPGYYLRLNNAEMNIAALFNLNNNIHLITQQPERNVNGEIVNYNNLVTIVSIAADQAITIQQKPLANSNDRLIVNLSANDNATFSLQTQHAEISQWETPCQILSHYEIAGI